MPLFHRLNNSDKYNEEHEPGRHNVPVLIDTDDEGQDDYRDSEDDENDNTTEGGSEHLNLMDDTDRNYRPEEDVEAIVHMEDDDDDEGEDSQLIHENSI